ncbi:related to dnaJ-like proteins [Cephalotrichum gorgonifer]|uniref:Related to dnaJ-like proteins n=1 Tax=Cephalotrichum gorgonifer TaxID=2041049 RepID=A0AAE8MW58_9PEZI|nr:related to dnaJ-like proteins [Cephalotrichum gorgonifer]
MGGQQSTSGGGGSVAVSRTCYYEVLGVDQEATSDDIRRAYRRKALELHPDKNIADVENATRRFAEVQSAYDILSDPQERAWYDSHRDAILQDQEVDDSGQYASFRNVRMTSAEEVIALVGRFNASVPFTDEPTGFFGSLREMFDQLAAEETAVGEHGDGPPRTYPSFGTSVADYDSVVKPFYAAWAGFSTRKTFAWKDKYRLSDAPDRRVRRMLEKENKKCRDDAIREFNDAVRFLIGFSKKRDPRYLPNTQSESDRQKALRETVAAQAARSRAANQEKMPELAEWVRAGSSDAAVDDVSESEEEDHIEEIECVVCNKTFKSENQYQAHERSKKHIKAVQQLRRDMRRENKDLDLEEASVQAGPTTSSPPASSRELSPGVESLGSPQPEAGLANDLPSNPDTDSDTESANRTRAQSDVPPRPQSQGSTTGSPADEPLLPSTQDAETPNHVSDAFASVTLDEAPQGSKPGKAKARRAKKAARQAASDVKTHSEMVCQVCNEGFSSRTKLFAHIRESKHAAIRPSVPHEAAKKPKRP